MKWFENFMQKVNQNAQGRTNLFLGILVVNLIIFMAIIHKVSHPVLYKEPVVNVGFPEVVEPASKPDRTEPEDKPVIDPQVNFRAELITELVPNTTPPVDMSQIKDEIMMEQSKRLENIIYMNNQELSRMIRESIMPKVNGVNGVVSALHKRLDEIENKMEVLNRKSGEHKTTSNYDKGSKEMDVGIDYWGNNRGKVAYISKHGSKQIHEASKGSEISNTKKGDVKILDFNDHYLYLQSKTSELIKVRVK